MKNQSQKGRIPVATYRLQFNRDFTFSQAASLIPYFEDLGITDVYSSPIFTAPPESNHGYDVCDYNQLNPRLGSSATWKRFTRRLRSRGMGLLMDFVPNHMGASVRYNSWWRDVLENGPKSRFANHFDIDWNPPQTWLRNKVLLPVLEDELPNLLAKNLLKVQVNQGRYQISYRDILFPTSPASRSFIRSAFANHSTGKVHFMQQLLERQHYVLMYWRTGTALANYRRFFDVDSLVAVNMDRPEVFEDTHQLVAKLVRGKEITGLRLDHIDGLADPGQYLTRLQRLVSKASATRSSHRPGKFYILVEKILMPGESLRPDWPVAGTTGYEFATQVTGVMIDSANEKSLTRIYGSFISNKTPFDEIVHHSKQVVMSRALSKEIKILARLAKNCVDGDPAAARISEEEVTSAITATINYFPRYRTYLRPATRITPEDKKILHDSIQRAKLASHGIRSHVFSLVEKCLLGQTVRKDLKTRQALFRRRFQQFTGPVMAKSFEDTAFFIYNRLIALNEVGGAPGQFGLDPAAFHQANISRLQREPAAMLTTSTHDTKMSEDARARVAAISELLEPWEKFVLNATAANRKFKTRVGQALAPARNDEYRFYQVLLATWPLEKMTAQNRKFYTSRLQEHMIKCLREAKTYTSWDHQNPACEKAMTSFVDDVINRPPAGFVNYFAPLAETIAELGAINSLSQTLLKLMVPGVPDIYQGNELWQFILTDPDNRRPIDFAIRRNLLASLKKHTVSALLQDWRSGALKLFLTKTVLNFRRTYPLLFQMGDYLPLKCQGEFENHCIAFARADGKRTIVVLVPRLTTPLGFPPIGECWASTFVNLAPLGKRTFVNLFTRAPVGSDRPKLSEIFRELPFAALTAV